MRINFLPPGEKKKITSYFEEQFGIEKFPGMLVEAGIEKIRLFSGSMTREEIHELNDTIRIELVGLYTIKKENDFRISFDALFLFEDQIKKNIIDLTAAEMEMWMRGKDLQKPVKNGTYVMKYKDLMLGCGKSNGSVIFNYVPKNRRFNK